MIFQDKVSLQIDTKSAFMCQSLGVTREMLFSHKCQYCVALMF